MEDISNMKANTTINITEENKKWFLSLKLHDRETANDIMNRLRKDKQNKKLSID